MATAPSQTQEDRLIEQQAVIYQEMKLMLASAERRDPPGFTPEEEKRFATLKDQHASHETRLTQLRSNQSMLVNLDKMTGGTGTRGRTGQTPGDGLPPRGESWGETFTKHPAIVEFLKAGIPTGGSWSSPAVDLRAAAVLESTSPIVEPQYLPEIVPGPLPPIVLSQLFAPGTATSGLIVYMKETLFTNAADAVAEGAAKPESTLEFDPMQTPLTKVATWLPASNEILEDVPLMLSYINGRLRTGVLVKLDDELLNGSGTAPHMTGLLVRTDLAPALPVGTHTPLDAIAMQIMAVETASELAVDGVVLNGTDWLSMQLTKTTTGEYLGGSPFEAGPNTVWGRTVATTPKMPQGTALVGSFRGGGGQLFLHPNMRTAISNSHQDFFIKNLVAVLSELRAALAVYRPQAFGKVTGLPAPTP